MSKSSFWGVMCDTSEFFMTGRMCHWERALSHVSIIHVFGVVFDAIYSEDHYNATFPTLNEP